MEFYHFYFLRFFQKQFYLIETRIKVVRSRPFPSRGSLFMSQIPIRPKFIVFLRFDDPKVKDGFNVPHSPYINGRRRYCQSKFFSLLNSKLREFFHIGETHLPFSLNKIEITLTLLFYLLPETAVNGAKSQKDYSLSLLASG